MTDSAEETALVVHRMTTVNSREEVSGQQLLSTFLGDEELNDITLQGTDGVQVKANRFVLSAKSKVFRRMFLGGFSEASKQIVQLAYEGSVLQALVEYIYTDSAEILARDKRKRDDDDDDRNSNDKCSKSIGRIQQLVSLIECANFYNLPHLCEKAQECVSTVIKTWPSLSFAVLEACKQGGPSLPAELKSMAMTRVRKDGAGVNIKARDVACLSPGVLEEVLKDPRLRMTELQLFTMLQEWVNAPTASLIGDITAVEERQTIAKDLVRHIRLDQIHPKYLSKTVRPSGLITTDQLLTVFEKQALHAAERHKRDIYQIPRYYPWTTSFDRNLLTGPVTVMVEGAGQPEVNGVYRQQGWARGAPRFVKRGTFEDSACHFFISQCDTTDENDYWFICIPGDAEDGANDIDFYSAPRMIGTDAAPPSDTWITIEVGLNPPPTILYRDPNGIGER